MSKRTREQSVEFIIHNDHTEIRYGNKGYYWEHPANTNLEKLINNAEFDFNILHNFENKAMLNVEHLRDNKSIIRYKINPIQFGYNVEWLVDK